MRATAGASGSGFRRSRSARFLLDPAGAEARDPRHPAVLRPGLLAEQKPLRAVRLPSGLSLPGQCRPGSMDEAGSEGPVGEADEACVGHAVSDLRAGPGQLEHADPGGHRFLAVERVPRRHDRGLGAASDDQLEDRPLHGGPNAGRSRLDRRGRDAERQRRPGDHPDEEAGPDSGQLHGLRGVRGADLCPGLHEDEEATVHGEEGPAPVLEPAGVHVLQAFLAAERRQGGQRLSQLHQQHRHHAPELVAQAEGVPQRD